MAFVEQAAAFVEPLVAERVHHLQHAAVFVHHVTRPPSQRRRQGFERVGEIERHRIDVAQALDVERGAGLLAFGAARAVFAGRVLMADLRVDDDQLDGGRQRHELIRQARGIEEQRVSGLAEAADHLVHDADRRADQLVFRALAEAGQIGIRQRQAERFPQRAQQRDFQRRARRQPAPHRHRRFDADVEPADAMVLRCAAPA